MFENLLQKIDSLRDVCAENIGSREIHEISVDVPQQPFDELYFIKTVAWCYVLFNETGPFIRFSGKLLRARPQAAEKYKEVKYFVQCARTVHAHNLLSSSSTDAQTKRYYEIWTMENGGKPCSWEKCSKALIKSMDEVLCEFQDGWRLRSEDESDRQELWRDYESEKRTSWDAHEFDPFVTQAANEAQLEDFNSAAFRKEGNRVERWRKLVRYFGSRESAEKAVRRVIQAEIFNTFGAPSDV
ncbi:hypothetical protein [Thalassospira lohafexi]|uniref:hypothetical protein n=1 Tax=Thalassospira lohafexi TaxID=744227 RepID=UPI001054F39D|nr:hypothetical protein [Thalassospira lohafexi]